MNTPESLRTDCPSCGYIAPLPAPSCERCSLVFAEWVPPPEQTPSLNPERQRPDTPPETPQEKARRLEALARLETIGKKVETRLSTRAKVIWLLVLAAPVVVFTVPDVNTRIFGAKLKYRGSKKDIRSFRSSAQFRLLSLESFEEGAPQTLLLTTQTEVDSQIEITETDTGGNNSYRKDFTRFQIESSGSGFGEFRIDGSGLARWQSRWTMNPYGGLLESLAVTTLNMARTAKAIDQQNLLRQEKAERSARVPFGKKSSSPNKGPALDSNVIMRRRLANLYPSDISLLDFTHKYKYPRDRVKPGASWTQPLTWAVPTSHFSLSISEPLELRVMEFGRQNGHFCVKVGWSQPVTGNVNRFHPDLSPPLKNREVSGILEGTAWIRYSDGFTQHLEGALTLSGSLPQEVAYQMANALGVQPEVPQSAFRIETKYVVGRR